jgi:manganese/iron transport system substrate-binding protein
MSKFIRFFWILVLLSGCSKGYQIESQTKARVVATSTVVCDLAKTIAQDTIDLDCLIKPGQDPHEYVPTPIDRRAFESSDLILYSGYNFEKGLIIPINSDDNVGEKVAVGELAVPKPQIFSDDGKITNDPHIFHDARNGAAMARIVEQSLIKLKPENRKRYEKAADHLIGQLNKIDTWIKKEIATIPMQQRRLITTHDAYGYFSTAYNIPIEGALQGVSTDEKPTAQRIKQLVEIIKKNKVPSIFVELTINPKLLNAVATESKAKVWSKQLYGDGLGAIGSAGDTYPKMLISDTINIVEGLGGKVTKPLLNN